MHRLYLAPEYSFPAPGGVLELEGEEAKHLLRVKRVEAGESIEVFDGQGRMAAARLMDADEARTRSGKQRSIFLRVESVRESPPPSPRIEVWSATPKGPRVDELVDQLSQVGAAAWVPMRCARSVVEPGASKLERLRRIAIESAKQCGRSWLLEIMPERALIDALNPERGTAIVLADASGGDIDAASSFINAATTIRLLIGPEGGFEPRELDAAKSAGVSFVRLGPHILRIETAAVAGAVLVQSRFPAAAPGKET